MKKKKGSYELIKEIRRNWTINPKTRIKENTLKDKKKRRQDERRIEKDE